jgi:protein-L-isoaspartate O-methyltransferase
MLGVLAHDDLAMVDYASAARLLLLSDDDAVTREVQAAAERLACRILARPLAAASEHLNEGGSFDAVFVSIGAETLPDALLTQLNDAGIGTAVSSRPRRT